MTAFTQLAQAARLALERVTRIEIEQGMDADEAVERGMSAVHFARSALTALDAALAAAQAVAEPVAWQAKHRNGSWGPPFTKQSLVAQFEADGLTVRALYTSPPAQAPAEVASKGVRDALETLVSLKDLKGSIATAPNANEAHRRDEQYRRLQPFAWIEARRVLATPTQPLPTAAAIEPFAFTNPHYIRVPQAGGGFSARYEADELFNAPLYLAAPVLANGLTEAALTDERIDELWKFLMPPPFSLDPMVGVRVFARAIEAAIRTEGKTE